MNQTNTTNRRFVLAERPKGAPTENTLNLETKEVPSPQEGEMLLRTVFLSLDPYMRGRMSDAPSYAPPVQVGEVMVGGTVAQVESSKLDGFKKGEWVLSSNGWQDYALSDGEGVTSLGSDPEHPLIIDLPTSAMSWSPQLLTESMGPSFLSSQRRWVGG